MRASTAPPAGARSGAATFAVALILTAALPIAAWSAANRPADNAPAGNPVDAALAAYWREKGVTPPPAVSGALWVRRAYLDAWGVLPTPGQLRAFERDGRPGKHERLVDALLSDSRMYAQHWITFWNDHLRNDEGVVYHGERQSITPWLLAALEANLPYDQFLRQLLDPREKSDPHGFLIGVNWRGDVSASQIPVMQAAQDSAQVFLGVNLKCNSCHDSFISKWKLRDAYGLASFFTDQPLEMYRCDAPTGETVQPKFLFPELGPGPAAGSTLAERRAAAASLFTKAENKRTPRTLVNRFWKVLFGRGIVEPVDEMDRPAWSPALLEALASDFAAQGYDLRRLLRTLMTSQAYRAASIGGDPPRPYVFRGPHPRRLTGEQFADAVSSITGEWRVLAPRQKGPAQYARDWQIKSTALARALGRPIRDQVITERHSLPTTLQALELVNGGTLARALERGARRLMGTLREPPAPLYDSGAIGRDPAPFDIAVQGKRRLWLVLEDVDTYDPARVKAGWTGLGAQLSTGSVQFREKKAAPALLMPLSSTRVIETGGTARLSGWVGADESSLASDISPRLRFFVFGAEPDRDRLIAPEGARPLPAPEPTTNAGQLIRRVYEHALARPPSPAEKNIAGQFLRGGKPEGLEDLLWSILMSAEFQYVR